MTTLSTESFLPSGAFETDALSMHNRHQHPYLSRNPYEHTTTYGNSTSIPTSMPSPPSSFPRSARNYHHFESTSASLQPPSNDSFPLSLASMRAAQASASQNHIPSHLQFESSFNPRPASLSPTRTPRADDRHNSLFVKPSARLSPGIAAASLSRSVSADAATPSQTSVHMVQRLAQQNSLIRDAWEAERNYLEANRRRAEEVYQEERAIMEDVRGEWENERAAMLGEMQSLKERVHRLEGENSALKTITSQSVQITGLVSPLASLQGGSTDISTENSSFSLASGGRVGSRSLHQTAPNSFTSTEADALPPGLDGASRRPHFFASPGSSRVSPLSQPEYSPFIPLDPRTQPENSNHKDFLPTTEETGTPVPVIDVQEIDSKLEGIPIKANAVQKSTFGVGGSPPSETSQRSSRANSPPTVPLQIEQNSLPLSSKENTLHVMTAAETRRLTMHAGHTPNHSLSLFPTVNATETSTIVGQSEGTTPTAELATDPEHLKARENAEFNKVELKLKLQRKEKGKGKGTAHFQEPATQEASTGDDIHDQEPFLEPEDDRPLKGPLMIRNMPAQDEIFFDALNKKLEPISQGLDALPTVMQSPLEENGPPGESSLMGAQTRRSIGVAGGDGSHDHGHSEDTKDESNNRKSVESDLPLKFRSTSNFGAPFGKM
ncbi:hypothetical protein G7046_g2913 [Stylonectria norvegica]|nr:hypothetical protein G7046_g2913 [Stylonectria norvegica]